MSVTNSGKKFPVSAAIAAEIPRLLMRIPATGLASATGRCQRTIANWFNGRTKPSLEDGVRAMIEFPELISQVAEIAGHKVITQAQYNAAKEALKILEGS